MRPIAGAVSRPGVRSHPILSRWSAELAGALRPPLGSALTLHCTCEIANVNLVHAGLRGWFNAPCGRIVALSTAHPAPISRRGASHSDTLWPTAGFAPSGLP